MTVLRRSLIPVLLLGGLLVAGAAGAHALQGHDGHKGGGAVVPGEAAHPGDDHGTSTGHGDAATDPHGEGHGGKHDDPIHHVIDARIFEGTFLDSIGVTKHVLMLWIAGGCVCLMGFAVGRSSRDIVPRGLRNLIEAILLFLRDEVAKPQLGDDADRYLPVIWTFFFFILFCNLLGLVPGSATATGNLSVTAGLALAAFAFYHAAGIQKQGLIHYLKSIVPPVPFYLYPVMLVVELIGHMAKPFALAVRLFANMIAGHIVMAVILGFATLSLAVAPISVAGGVFMYFLETFVAFLQAFIFTFLMTVFLGMAVHPEH